MKTILRLFIGFLVFITLSSSSCSKHNNRPSTNDCTTIMCTDLFAMITVLPVDRNNNPLQLTDAYTVRTGTNEIIRANPNYINSMYVVLDDSYCTHLRNDTDTFIFTAVNGTDTVRMPFVIAADCCHVTKISGGTTIVIP